jgi:hypothetical protein
MPAVRREVGDAVSATHSFPNEEGETEQLRLAPERDVEAPTQ